VTARARSRRSRIVKGLVATVAVCSMLSVAIAAPADAKSKPKSLKKLDLHALVACTGVDVSTSGAFLLNQPPDPNVLFNVVTGFSRSRTKGAHKEAKSLQLASSDQQSTALNYSMLWCTDHGYTPRVKS
jgi:hypothetical protein